MQSYLLTIAYDGTNYSGWQRQAGFDSVQERLERAFATVIGEPITVHGAGRTDAGVHALRQCAHVRLPEPRACDELLRAINGNIPRDLAVTSVEPVAAGFHARFSATGKRYMYRFVFAGVRPVFGRSYYHWARRALDVDAMRAAAWLLLGRHDFAAFATNPGYVRRRGTERTIQRLHLIRRSHGVDMLVQGDGFLYNMVRTIAGTLRDVGTGKLRPDRVGEILRSRDRSLAGMTMEPGGLYLVRVLYPKELEVIGSGT